MEKDWEPRNGSMQLILTREPRIVSGEMIVSSTNGSGQTGLSHAKD